jgi:hypothetical protein
MGMVSALFSFGLFTVVEMCILVAHFKWSRTSMAIGVTTFDAMAFVLVLVFGVVFSLVFLADPAFP